MNTSDPSITAPSILKWERLIPLLWCEVSEILKICLADIESNGALTITADNRKILDLYEDNTLRSSELCIKWKENKATGVKECVETIPNPYFPYSVKTDQHLLDGLLKSHWQRGDKYPRLAELTINACHVASMLSSKAAIVIPSPLFIIYSFLTDPDNSCTAAYALTVCRNWLSRVLNVWPVLIEYEDALTPKSTASAYLTNVELKASIESFANYHRIGARWPDQQASTKSRRTLSASKHVFIGSYLAIRGIAFLWLPRKPATENNNFLSLRGQHEEVQRTRARALFENSLFVLSPSYERLPPSEEIGNQLFGYPLPIKGMDVVFNGGLRPSTSGGLVMAVSGQPGAGKTSFALALGNALRPFGTPTYYISLEETESDIRHKLISLRPEYEERLCITKDYSDLFFCRHFSVRDMDYKKFEEQLTLVLGKIIPARTANIDGPLVAGTCPGIVVVDNLNVIDDRPIDGHNPSYFLERIIASCRSANILTVLICPQDFLTKHRLNYLADFVVDLRYEKLNEVNDRPVRIFNLMKTRHQQARQGAHVFHIGGGKGFRIVPNMDSIMDRRSNLSLHLFNKSRIIHALNFCEQSQCEKYLKVFSESNILLHGYGSSGKAGLALRLLLTPPVSEDLRLENVESENFSGKEYRQKVLVISFLYPDAYYNELVYSIHAKLRKTFKGLPKPELDYIVLYPGFIGPQDLLNKIAMMLDRAKLSGRPYTGILVDGLHNVFLQYPRLQDADIIWAMLYNILGRYPLTTVSTFTTFSVNEGFIPPGESHGNSHNPDSELMQKGMTPFLHALIKATDFYLVLHEYTAENSSKLYPLMVRSAVGQAVPTKIALWNREHHLIEKYVDASDIFQNKNNQSAVDLLEMLSRINDVLSRLEVSGVK